MALTKLLIRFIEKRKKEAARRSALAQLSCYTCIFCNLLLFAVKFAVGTLTASVAIIADGVNNFSDSAANIVTLIGNRLSGRPGDKEHPFGHGRIEYISALIVTLLIFLMSFEIGKSAVLKIVHPAAIHFDIRYCLVLAGTVLVKLWMAYFNQRLYRLTDNLNLKAVRQDSLNDCIATTATILSLVLAHRFDIPWIDGVIGICVAVFILFSGIAMLRQVLGPLLGEAPSKELTERIETIICESDEVLGVHDLILHNYGANKIIASAHAEVSAETDIFTLHEIIDRAEHKIEEELGVSISIHIDPVATDDGEEQRCKATAEKLISAYNPRYTFHDFRLTETETGKRLSFDLSIPFDEGTKKELIAQDIERIFSEKFPAFQLDIHVEHSYV